MSNTETHAPPADAEEPPFDASDPEQVQKAKSKAGRKRKAEVDVVQALMSSRDGRAWLWGHLVSCHIYEACFHEGRPDATAFQLGERNVGLKILADMNRYPDLMMVMMQERLND